MEKCIERIKEVIDKIRPFLNEDGGDIEYVDFKDGIVYVRMIGHCQGCPMLDVTLKESVEVALTSEIEEVIEVRNIDD